MKKYSVVLFLIGALSAGAQQIPISTFSGGGGQGSGAVPSFFGSFGQPMLYPRTAPGMNGGGVMNANELMFPTIQLADEPAAQPTGLAFSNLAPTSFTVSFVAASPAPSGYIILRKPGSTVTEVPTDGVEYTVNTAIGGATIVSIGTATSLGQSSLTEASQYAYAVFSYNTASGKAINYRTTSPLTGSRFTLASEPTQSATGPLTFDNITSSSLTVSYNAPAVGPSGYLVIRRKTTAPTTAPVDGTGYTAGSALGSGTVAYSGPNTTFDESGLDASSTYFYAVFVYNGATNTYNYLTTSSLTGSVATLAPGQEQATNLVLTTISDTQIDGSFDAAVQVVSGYLVLRSIGSADTNPANGTVYTQGATIGNATVVAADTDLAFSDTGLSPATTYTYKIISYTNAASPSYFSGGLTGSSTTFAAEPAAPTSFSASNRTATSLTISYQAAAEPAGFLVVRRTVSTPVTHPVDGVAYALNTTIGTNGLVVYVGNQVEVNQSGLNTYTKYYYHVYAYNGTTGTYNYSAALTGDATTLTAEPGSGPSSLLFSNVTDASMDVAFTAATGSPTGYLALRKQGSEVTANPTGGVMYNEDDVIGDAVVAYKGSAVSFQEAGLQSGTNYFYKIFSYNVQGADNASTNYTTSPLTGNRYTLASEPANQPTSLNFSNVTSSSLQGSFTAAVGGASGYLVVRNDGNAAFSGTLVDGTQYSLSQQLGNGTVVSIGSTTSFSETGLQAEQEYRYTVFAYNGDAGTFNYNHADAALSGTVTMDQAPQTQPTNLIFSNIQSNQLTGSFSAAPSAPTGGYLVVRRAGALPTGIPTNGNTYAVNDPLGDGTVVSASGPATLDFTDVGLQAATTYYYLIFAFSGTTYEIVSPLSGSQITLETEPGAQPTSLAFSSITTSSMTVNFTLASGNLPVLVVRNEGSAPTFIPIDGTEYTNGQSVTGGTIVAKGTTNQIDESGLTSGATYHYAVYSYSGSNATVNYRTTSPLAGSATTLAVEPTAQPTAMTFATITQAGFQVSFTGATPSPAAYLVLRKTSEITEVPVDGTAYTTSSTIGGADVAHMANTTAFTETTLAAATRYYYKAFAVSGSGASSNYNTTSPLSGNQTTLALQPAAPTSLALDLITTNSMRITITDAATPDGYLVVRSTAALNTQPVNGNSYALNSSFGNGTVVSITNSKQFQQAGLQPATTYFFTAFAFNGSDETTHYRLTSVSDNDQTEAVNQSQPTNLTFGTVTASTIAGSFTAPSPAPTGYLVLRKAGSLPTGVPQNTITYTKGATLGDGTVVDADANVTFLDDTGLTSATEYFYKIFAYNGSGAATTYATSGPLAGSRSTLASQPAAPTSIEFTNISSSGFDVTVTSSGAGYLAVRKAGSIPAFVPVNGTSYAKDEVVSGDETVAYIGSASSFNETALSEATAYSYAIYSYNGSGLTSNYNSSALIGSESTLSGNASQPSALIVSNVTSSSGKLTFTAAASTPTGYIVLRGLEPNFVPDTDPSDFTSYSVNDVIGNSKVSYRGGFPGAGITETNLAAEKVYHYKIYSYNGTGASTTYVTESPLTGKIVTLDTEPGGAPTNISFDNITTNSAEITITASGDLPPAEGFLLLQASSQTDVLATKPLDGTKFVLANPLGNATVVGFANETRFTVSNLTPGTTYHYAVYPYRGTTIEGVSTHNYLTLDPVRNSSFITLIPDNTPPEVTLQSVQATVALGANVPVSAHVEEPDNSVVTDVYLDYRSLSGETVITEEMTLTSGTNKDGVYSFTIPGASVGELGVTYTVRAVNSAIATEGTASATTRVTFSDPIIPESDLNFGGTQSAYNIVAFPLTSGSNTVGSILSELGPVNNLAWRMFHYESATETRELDLSSTLTTGRGYWLIVKEETAISIGDGTSVDPGVDGFSVVLQPGYNQIGNPYMFNVSWDDVKQATGNPLLELKTFNGNFAPADRLRKFEGGFVSVTEQTTLIFPPTKDPAFQGRQNSTLKVKKNPLSNPDWQVGFVLENGERRDVFGGVGMHPDAKPGADFYDDFTLPRLGEYVELNHVGKRMANLAFTKDIVPSVDNYTWEFNVETNMTGINTLSWDNSYFGNNNSQLALWDENEKRTIDMREYSEYKFEGSRRFKVVFGGEGYVKDQTQVKNLILHHAYPNPTAGILNVTFTIPDKGQGNQDVLIAVTNSMGQVISTIFEGKLAPGTHEMVWNGKDSSGMKPAHGIYIIQATSGYDTDSKRIMVK